MAKSSYAYQKKIMLDKNNRLEDIRFKICTLFQEVKERYGYRRIHQELKKQGYRISEKIVRRIMKEEHLHVRNIKRKKYSSYLGEISPAVENKIQRDFHAEKPKRVRTKLGTEIYKSGGFECTLGKKKKLQLNCI